MDTLSAHLHIRSLRYNKNLHDDYVALTNARRADTSACDRTRFAKYETVRVSCGARRYLNFRGSRRGWRTYLEVGVEPALLEVLRGRTERVHEVTAYGRIALNLPGENRLDIGEDAVKHLGNGDEGALEELEVTGGVGKAAVGGVGEVRRE